MTDAVGPALASPCESESGVLRQTLQVTALCDGQAALEGQRASACASCAAKTGCGAGALAEILGGTQTLRVPQTLPLAVGDNVVLAMDRRAFLGAALRAYLLPPAVLVAMVLLARMLGLADLLTALLCLPALALALVPLWRSDRRGLSETSLWLEPVPEP